MNKKPNFIHQENHAGKVFTGNAVWMAYYMINRTLDKYEKYWCIKRIKRKNIGINVGINQNIKNNYDM